MERSDAWFIAAVAAIMGFLAGMAWMDTGHPAGRLETYQTLITGFLAVAAAFITVNAMKRTDHEQRLRHAEQMDHARRPERLARERVVEIYPTFFGYLAEEAEEVGLLVTAGMGRQDVTRSLLKTVDHFVTFLHSAVRDEAIRQARPFFGAAIEMNFSFIALKDEEFQKADYREFLKHQAVSTMDGTVPDAEDTDYFLRLCHTIQDMARPLRALSGYFADFDKHQALTARQ